MFSEMPAVLFGFFFCVSRVNIIFHFRVFQLISLMDAQLPRSSNEKVELAILWFLDQFRKTYVGDQLQRTSKVGAFPSYSTPLF